LNNSEFKADAKPFYEAIAAVHATTPMENIPRVATELAESFVAKWGVPPPPSPELLRPDSRRKYVDALASGRWSVIPVFPWTTRRDIEAAVRRSRKRLGKQHQDRDAQERRVQLASWFDACGIGGPDIAKAVWGRYRGLGRRSSAHAIGILSYAHEERLLKKYLEQGRSYPDAERLVLKRARRSEAPASAAMRVASDRYYKGRVSLNTDLALPREVDRRSHALTMLFRAATDGASEEEIRRHVNNVLKAFIETPLT
jgi:hypothetical protein